LEKKSTFAIKTITAVTFVAMVTVNALANILPINGINTGQVSDAYPNLFAPAGLTFAIWGLIYLLLAMFTLFQFGLFQNLQKPAAAGLLFKIGLVFSISSLANTVWIFSWHFQIIPLSMLLMLVILACLIYIMQTIRREKLSGRDRLFIRLPFSVYFGWITVATIANATTLLVSWNWNGFGIPVQIWMILIIIVGMLIGSAITIKNHDIAYGLVLVWAYTGILIKHLSPGGFAGKYPEVIAIVIFSLVLLLVAIGSVLVNRRQTAKNNL
jgi:hypothetical protein